MAEQHPMQPPPELLIRRRGFATTWEDDMRAAYAAGADQELEACCEWLERNQGRWEIPASLRAARRPKPPSLANEALRALGSPTKIGEARVIERGEHNAIRRALERLAELEAAQDSPSDHH